MIIRDTMQEYISDWNDIYKGKQEWLQYKYATLEGRIRKRRRKTMNAAKMICSELSGLIWAEMPEVMIDDSVLQILEDNNFYKIMPNFTENILALGGGVIKINVKDNKILLDFIPAYLFNPVSWDNKRIYEADFLDYRIIDNRSFLRIEKHRKLNESQYIIENEAFEIINGQKHAVSLVQIDDTLEKETIVNVYNPLFSYIRATGDNNLIESSKLGISLYANAIDTLEAIDVCFDALNQEIVLGKKRIIVPSSAVRKVFNSEGKPVTYFDPSDEVYQAFNIEDNEKLQIQDNSVSLRISELREAMQTLLNILSVQTGFSTGYFSFDGVSMKTATEVISENSKTFKTKQNQENEIRYSLLQLFESLREVAYLYNYPVTSNEYNITFNDSIIEDRNTKAQYWLQRYRENTCLLEDVLMNIDGLTEQEAIEKAELIRSKSATIDVNNMFGGIDIL